MTEVEYGEGGHRTRLGEINDQLVCLEVPPAPVYKGARGRPAGPPRARQEEGRTGEGEKEGREEEKERGGGATPSLSNSD